MAFFLDHGDVSSFEGVVLDCRFSLTDAAAGREAYAAGHVPGALYVDLNTDLSAPVGEHGGRHPLPSTADFAKRMAALGVGPDTPVLLYDDSRYAFAARCWWMLRALKLGRPQLLSGGYSAWVAAGNTPETQEPDATPVPVAEVPGHWPQCCTRDDISDLQSQGAQLVDAREAVRYRGEQEPIDPIAGHIPGAENLPWQNLSTEDGVFLDEDALRERWAAIPDASPLVVYCGSGVSACVNILSLAVIGRDDVILYGGSWSDWCSYL